MLQRCFGGNPLLVAVCRYLFLKSLKARQVLGNTLGTQEIPVRRKFWFSSWSKDWKMRKVNFQALLLPLPFKFNISLSLILQKIRNSLLHWAFPTAKIALACKNPIVHSQVYLFKSEPASSPAKSCAALHRQDPSAWPKRNTKNSFYKP